MAVALNIYDNVVSSNRSVTRIQTRESGNFEKRPK